MAHLLAKSNWSVTLNGPLNLRSYNPTPSTPHWQSSVRILSIAKMGSRRETLTVRTSVNTSMRCRSFALIATKPMPFGEYNLAER